jgi:hypothetical protein
MIKEKVNHHKEEIKAAQSLLLHGQSRPRLRLPQEALHNHLQAKLCRPEKREGTRKPSSR